MVVGVSCPLCEGRTTTADLAETDWFDDATLAMIAVANPRWQRGDGACPACVQHALLQTLLVEEADDLHEQIQTVWPLDAEAAFKAMPTPLRLHADPRFTGKGVTIAMIDSGFYPHPDLVQPDNRIRAWVDATQTPPLVRTFTPTEQPTWPGWEAQASTQWHGLMTTVAAAGNGWLSHGLYRGLAGDADLVLVKVWDDGIDNETIRRALRWVEANADRFGIRLVNLSLGGEPVAQWQQNEVDKAVTDLVAQNVVVTVAAGNDGVRRLVPPATAPAALTIGGIDDQNTFTHDDVALWHSNYGRGGGGVPKPELVAPSIWVAAPVLPQTQTAVSAQHLFSQRGQPEAEARIRQMKFITPHYQHVDGTSFAAPLVASGIACMLEANPALTPALVREILLRTAHRVPGAPVERQGAGAFVAGLAVAHALQEQHPTLHQWTVSPIVSDEALTFIFHDHSVERVQVLGSWDNWSATGLELVQIEPGVWQGERPLLPSGRYLYKFLLNGRIWLDDPANPHKVHDGYGGFNSLINL